MNNRMTILNRVILLMNNQERPDQRCTNTELRMQTLERSIRQLAEIMLIDDDTDERIRQTAHAHDTRHFTHPTVEMAMRDIAKDMTEMEINSGMYREGGK